MKKPLSHRLFRLGSDASKIVMIFASLLLVVSCGDDDQGYTPLNINAVADVGEVYQNGALTLDILKNDTNVPIDGQILLDSP